jgi:hypothetical protein
MNFYDLLEKLVKELPSINDQQAAREVITSLRGVNAFGSVVAGMESETPGDKHVHRPETRLGNNYGWANKLIDVCSECGAITRNAYDPPVNRMPGYRGY